MYYFNILSLLVLLSCFVLLAGKRIGSYIWTFRAQSLVIALTAGIMGFKNIGSVESINMLAVCALIIGLKVVYIPRLLGRTFYKVDYTVQKDFFLNIPLHVMIGCGLYAFSYIVLSRITGFETEQPFSSVVSSVAVILIGLFFMISRKKAIGQMVGFLVIENGLFTTAMFATNGMPLVVDLGIFIDMITAIMIMGILVFRINERFETIDTDKMRKLKG